MKKIIKKKLEKYYDVNISFPLKLIASLSTSKTLILYIDTSSKIKTPSGRERRIEDLLKLLDRLP